MPAFGAIMLSADVITNPAIPPKILSDSLIIISAISGFNRNFFEISEPSSEILIFCNSIILPCEFEIYFVEITKTSPSCNFVLFFSNVSAKTSKTSNFSSILSAKSGKTVRFIIF